MPVQTRNIAQKVRKGPGCKNSADGLRYDLTPIRIKELVVPEKSLVDKAAALESINKMKQKIASGEKKSNGEPYTENDIDYRVI
ncbi:10520_t:CDS:2, partial [Paraglomus occultum]